MSVLLQDIWCGWDHVREPLTVSQSVAGASLNPKLLDSYTEALLISVKTWFPDVLWDVIKQNPASLNHTKVPKDVIEDALTHIVDETEEATLHTRYRIIEVLQLGNRLNLFDADLPDLPIVFPDRPRSPFVHDHFIRFSVSLPRIKQPFLRSLGTVHPIGPVEQLGQLYISAMLFGGLILTEQLLALPQAVHARQRDLNFRWLDILLVRPRKSEKVNGETRRWIPDPLSRLLIIKGLITLPTNSDLLGKHQQNSRQLMTAIRAYGRQAKIPALQLVSLRLLQDVCRIHLQSNIPPYLAHFARYQQVSVTLPNRSWRRLVDVAKPIVMGAVSTSAFVLRQKMGSITNTLLQGQVITPSMQTLLKIVVQSSQHNLNSNLRVWYQNNSKAMKSVAVGRLTEWILYWLRAIRGGGKASLSKEQVQLYLVTMGYRLAGSLGNVDPATLGIGELQALYFDIIDDIDEVPIRRITAEAVHSFHAFLVNKHNAEEIDEDFLSVYGRHVDANLISHSSFIIAQQWVSSEAQRRFGISGTGEMLSIMMSLGFYCGLRKREILGLRTIDFVGEEDLYLNVHKNYYRQLKTSNSERMLPISKLMSDDAIQELKKWLNHRRKAQQGIVISTGGGQSDELFFPDFYRHGKLLLRDKRYKLILEGLRRSTDDSSFDFHHLRHSFANWMMLRFALYEIRQACGDLPDWFLPDSDDREFLEKHSIESLRESILGKATTNKRTMMQISHMLGHASSVTTLFSYLHLLDLLLGIYCRRMVTGIDEALLKQLVSHRTKVTGIGGCKKDQVRTIRHLRVASILDQESDQLCKAKIKAKKKAIRRARIIDAEEKVELVLRALQLLEISTEDDVSKTLHIDKTRIKKWQARAKLLPKGITRNNKLRNRYTHSGESVSLPAGERQLDLSKTVSLRLDRLRKQYIGSEKKPQLARKKIKEALSVLVSTQPTYWQSSTPLTLSFSRVPPAKRWLWLLKKLGYDQGIKIEHHPQLDKPHYRPENQRREWVKALGVKRVSEKRKGVLPLKGVDAPKGKIDIIVSSQVVSQDYMDTTGRVLEAVRLALVAEWVGG